MNIRRSQLHVLVLLLVFGIGCEMDTDATVDDESDWEFLEDPITLERDLYISEEEDFFVGSALDIEADESGQIYVADSEHHHVKVLSSDGELEETIGREGEGPGEFNRVAEVRKGRGDSLYVLDVFYSRLHVFDSSYDVDRSVDLRGEQRGARQVYPLNNGRYVAMESSPSHLVVQGEAASIRLFDEDGTPEDTLFTLDVPDIVYEEMNGGMIFYGVPFSPASYLALDSQEQVHYAYSDSLGATVIDLDGEIVDEISIPFDPVPVTADAREAALEGRDSDSRAMVEPAIPEYRPAFTRFAIDDQDRYWFRRSLGEGDETEWWIADPGERTVQTAEVPSNVDFRVIKNGHAYGLIGGRDELPAVVRYTIHE